MKEAKIRSLNAHPIIVAYKDGEERHSVALTPSNVTTDAELGAGVTRLAQAKWDAIKADPRIASRLGKTLLEV